MLDSTPSHQLHRPRAEGSLLCSTPLHHISSTVLERRAHYCARLHSVLLTDHYGGELVESLFPFLLQTAERKMMVRKCGLGSPYTVNFVLQMPSGSVCQFTGRPDFSINSPYAGAVARFTLRGVGEIQSPPWRRKESKSAALSQAGIYTLGQFANGAHTSGSLPAIVVHKDKTAQVAIGRVNHDEKKIEHSLGTATFRLIGQVDSLDLKDPDDLRTFSGLLKGVVDIKN